MYQKNFTKINIYVKIIVGDNYDKKRKIFKKNKGFL